MNKLIAEFFGTLWLVLGGCGSAVLAAAYPEIGDFCSFGRMGKQSHIAYTKEN